MACSGMKKVKRCLTLNNKLEILRIYDSTEGSIKINELAKTLKISRSTLLTIISNRKNIETAPESDRHRFRTRNKRNNPYAGKSKYQVLDEALANWVREIKAKGEPFTGVILRSKALKLAAEMGFDNFTASNGWSDRFKKKYNFEYKEKPCFCQYKPQNKSKLIATTKYGAVNFLDKIASGIRSDGRKGNGKRNESDMKVRYNLIEEQLILWLNEVRNDQIQINGNMIKEMALSIAGILGVTKFRASSGWLNRFQKRYNIFKHKKCDNCKKNSDYANTERDSNEDTEAFSGNEFTARSKEEPKENDEVGMKRKKTESDVGEPQKSLTGDGTIISDPREGHPPSTNDRLKCFQDISIKITKEEEYRRIKFRLEKMEIELEILNLARKLFKTKKLNLRLEIENLKMRLDILSNS